MKFEDLKVGQFVRWVANRRFKEWDTYSEVILKTEDTVTLLSLDDLSETVLNASGDAVNQELSLATHAEVENYFTKRRDGLRKSLSDMQYDHLIAQGELIKKIDKFLEYGKGKFG